MVSLTFTDEAVISKKKPRNRATEKRKLESLEHDVEFICVDGEGETREYFEEWDETERDFVLKKHDEKNKDERIEVQDYVLLSVGDQQLHNNGQHLSYERIFEFLYDQFLEHPKAAFVGFSLGYDFTQWFRTMPAKTAHKLLTKPGIESRTPTNGLNVYPWAVNDAHTVYDSDTGPEGQWVVGKWSFDILGDKRFKIRPHVDRKDYPPCEVDHKTPETIATHMSGECKIDHPFKWMYICDVFPFFQSSFLKVIDPNSKDVIKNNYYTYVYDVDHAE